MCLVSATCCGARLYSVYAILIRISSVLSIHTTLSVYMCGVELFLEHAYVGTLGSLKMVCVCVCVCVHNRFSGAECDSRTPAPARAWRLPPRGCLQYGWVQLAENIMCTRERSRRIRREEHLSAILSAVPATSPSVGADIEWVVNATSSHAYSVKWEVHSCQWKFVGFSVRDTTLWHWQLD